MVSFKLITSFLLTYLITVNCGPINKRQLFYNIASDCGSAHLAPLPTIITGRAALSSIPLRYAEPIPAAAGPSGAFRYAFTVPAPAPAPRSFIPIARANDCSHTTFVAPPETAHLPAAPLLPSPPPPPPAAPILTDCHEAPTLTQFDPIASLPPPPPPQQAAPILTDCHEAPTLTQFPPIAALPPPPPPQQAPILTDCHEAPTLTQFAPIAAIPPPPPPPPAELPPLTPAHTEPCFETAPAAPAPIYTGPAYAPLPPPSHIINEPLKSPGCFETAQAPTFITAPQPPQAVELAPPPPPPPHFESPTLGGQISALDCHGAAPITGSFGYPSQPLESYYYGDATHTGGAEEGFPEILEAKSLHKGFGERTGISHPFYRLAKTAKY